MKRLLVLLMAACVVSSGAALADPAMRAVQARLKSLGFYRGEIDGTYGSQTAAAIRRYQLAEDLRVTGELTPETLEHLGLARQTAKKPVPEHVALAALFKGGPFITAPTELQIAAIRQAQNDLKLLGYYAGPADGSPSSELVGALKAWQKSAGFRQTGRFDENTLKGLDIMPN